MKKFSILLLALAIAAFAVPAMAGDVAFDGEYTFGGEALDEDVTGDRGTFYDELDLNIEVSMDDVLFHWDVEIVDDGDFDRENDEGGVGNPSKLVDTMYVKWSVNDALTVKIGDYGSGWGNDIVMDAPQDGTGTVGIMYGLDAADLAFYLSRDDEDGENDITTMGVTAEGEVGPAELGLLFFQTTDDITDDSGYGLMGVYGNFAAGPVGIALEYGSVSADDAIGNDGGTILLAEFALDDLVGFGLTAGVVQTNEDFDGTNYGDDFDRAKIYDLEPGDTQMVYVGAEYGYSDELSLGLDAILMNDVADGDGPTEIDVWVGYSLADNVGMEAGYAMFTTNDFEGLGGDFEDYDEDATLMWYEFVFEF